MATDKQDALASLYDWTLERDDSGPFRVYKDEEGQEYHSVTHILKNTAPEEQKASLARWSARPGSDIERQIACDRGTVVHENCEYVLKTASRLVRHSANARNTWRVYGDGLARAPKSVVSWALKKAIKGAPEVPWAAREHARGLSGWLGSGAVTAIHASEFSVFHTDGWAGTADALIDTEYGLTICDFKTTGRDKDKPEKFMRDHQDQLAAYSLAMKQRSGIVVDAGAVVIAKGNGEVQLRMLSELEMRGAECRWLERHDKYKAMLELGEVC